ncbi:hypothetical protein [Haloquadratum walsbyi]|nr:hypothetical protein [Haloquadratum walsbyi]
MLLDMEKQMTDTIDAVERALTSEQKETFDARVAREAARIKHDIRNGQFDSDHVAVGLELEAYIVDSKTQLAPAPETVFELNGCSPELGVHNVEFHTTPDAIGAESDNGGSGFRRQASELHHIRDSIRSHIDDVDRTLVYDSLWTIPPETGTDAYLRAGTTEHGIFFAENVRPIPRYIALNEVIRERSGGTVELGLPGLDTAPSMLVESLATSIQPHLQIPDPRDAAAYLNAATRTMGPLLSLTANSPFLPADCYAGVSAEVAADRLARTPHELRIPIFERAVDTGAEKCRVPADADDIFDVIDRIVTDPTLVASSTLETPIPASDADPCDLSVFPTKRGTYWRWVRPVFCGQTPRGGAETTAVPTDHTGHTNHASVRIEYRPLPTQPTIRDTIGVQALVTGVLHGAVTTNHPLETLTWDDAEESFYAAVADGPTATLAWVDDSGTHQIDQDAIYADLFSLARRGLSALDVSDETIEWALTPIESRRDGPYQTPSEWKRDRVEQAVSAGTPLPAAITQMQTAYVEYAQEGIPFAEWS